jgi:hygromycin-B 4-O-kinase
MSQERTLISDIEVQKFLNEHHNKTVIELTYLTGGKHSEAFSYTVDSKNYVVRFNEKDRGFLKDRYAYEHFSKDILPIPQVYDIGKYKDGVYYCISEKVIGETVRAQYNAEDFSSLFVQFEMIEKIKEVRIDKENAGFGEWDNGEAFKFSTLSEYIRSVYESKDMIEWENIKLLPYFEQDFVNYLIEKVEHYLPYSNDVHELVHGDFGGENLFVYNSNVSGIIDWDRSLFGDHFLDVGRVVLFCPNREATVTSALDYYKDKEYEHYKERIALGVYYAMLRNYGVAVQMGNKASCDSSRQRIKQCEDLIGL